MIINRSEVLRSFLRHQGEYRRGNLVGRKGFETTNILGKYFTRRQAIHWAISRPKGHGYVRVHG